MDYSRSMHSMYCKVQIVVSNKVVVTGSVWWAALQFLLEKLLQGGCQLFLKCKFLGEQSLLLHEWITSLTHLAFNRLVVPLGLRHCWPLLDLAGRETQTLGIMDNYLILTLWSSLNYHSANIHSPPFPLWEKFSSLPLSCFLWPVRG